MEIVDGISFKETSENEILKMNCNKNAKGEIIRKCGRGTEPEWSEYESTCSNYILEL